MKSQQFQLIQDQPEISRILLGVHSRLREHRPQRISEAKLGYKGGNDLCKIRWFRDLGFWVAIPPKDWDKRTLSFGCKLSKSMHSITVKVNAYRTYEGQQIQGAILAQGNQRFLAHTGGISGGKKRVAKFAFLKWYGQKADGLVEEIER